MAGRPPRPRADGPGGSGRPRRLRSGIREGAVRHGRGGRSPGSGHRLRERRRRFPRSARRRLGHPRSSYSEDLLSRGRYPVVLEAVRLARRRYGDTVPVVSSMLGPFTIAGCLFGVETLLIWMIEEPEKVQAVMETATRLVADVYPRTIRRRLACGPGGRADGFRGPHLPCAIPGARGAVPPRAGGRLRPSPHHPHLREHHPPPAASGAVGFRGVSFDVKTDIHAARSHLKGKAALIGYVPT